MSTNHIKVRSTNDNMHRMPIGLAVTSGGLAGISNSSVIDNIISTTVNGKFSDKQPYLWSARLSDLKVTSIDANLYGNSYSLNPPKDLFTATFPVGTDTGVIRSLALRLNVSVSCASVAQSEFPPSCFGGNSFNQTFSNINDSDLMPFGDLSKPRHRTRICAPGDILASPWQNTSDRQDVYEEFWLDFQRTLDRGEDNGRNFTQHCYGNSTLGYFELPNHWNGHVAGSLLDKVPPNGRNLSYSNGDEYLLSEAAPPEGGLGGIAGPFLTAIVAVFGPNTFFNTIASNSNYTDAEQIICTQLRYPFTGLSSLNRNVDSIGHFSWNQAYPTLQCPFGNLSDGVYSSLLEELVVWLPNFGDDAKATAALTFATYAASNAILNVGPSLEYLFLYSCAGSDLQKPTMPLAAMVVITLLLAAQLVGLAFLAIYASRIPSWTESLDAWAILRIGAELGPDVTPVSTLEARRASVLDERKGWVGDAGVEGWEMGVECRELVLGGKERVRGGAMYRMVRGKDRGADGEI